MPKDKVVTGIDVGSSKVATIIATYPPDEPVNVMGVSSVQSRGIRKGQVVDIEEAVEVISKSLEEAERMAGYSVGSAFVTVGGSQISSQNSRGVVAVAEPDKEISQNDVDRVIEAAKAISLPSSREILHVLPRGYIVDSQEGIKDPIGMTGVRLEAETHIISTSATATRNLAKCLNKVGVDIDSMVFGGMASSEAVLSETEKELGVVLVDIGGGTTDICLYTEGALAFSSVLPVGAKNITSDLAIGLRVSLESAEKIKLFLGQKPRLAVLPEDMIAKEEPKEEKDIDLKNLGLPENLDKISHKTLTEGIIKPRLNEIFTMVGLEIKKSGFGGLTPAGLVITGGGSETIGALEAAKRILAMPVRKGIPAEMTGLIDEIQTPVFSAALGLAVYGRKTAFSEDGTSFIRIPKISSFPVKGAMKKTIDFIKSFLP